MRATGIETQNPQGHESVMLVANRRHELPVSPIEDGSASVLVRQSGQLIGQTLDSPQGLLAISASMGTRVGQAEVKIDPQIHHGASRQKFISGDAALRLASSRQTWSLDEMKLTWTAGADEILVIGPDLKAGSSFGLGKQWLQQRGDLNHQGHVMVLLRIESLPTEVR
jgi:hypothetical protein